MCNVIILQLFMLLFGADWEAEAIKGTIPGYTIATRDSIRFRELDVTQAATVWENFSYDYLNERGRKPDIIGYSSIQCDNPWVHYTGLAIADTVKLYVLGVSDRLYYIETIKPLR